MNPQEPVQHARRHREGGDDIVGIIVEEIDGAPSVKNVTRIKVTNGAETDNGDGSVTLNLAGSSTGAAIGDSFITISHDADLTAERTLALAPADGEHTFTDGGANASVTLVGVDATATQKGHAILGQPMGLTGATAATRYVGATASGVPGSGTFAVGDFVIDQTGRAYVCTVAGSPGTWAPTGAGSGDALVTIGHPFGLSAERALALTPADGEHTFTDGGANGAVTLVGVTATTGQVGHAQFDSTNPTTQASGDSPTPGTSGIIADRAHKHGMPKEHHTVMAVLDVTVASTSVPYQLVGPMAAAGTIVAVYAKLGENKTNGATSSVFDIHKIAAADINTDGTGTTIYTTQGNRPTIANTVKGVTATAPDVTTFAAGDWFCFYTDQAGTTATVATVAMTVTFP